MDAPGAPPPISGLKRSVKRVMPLAVAYYVLTNLRARYRSEIEHMGQSETASVGEGVDYVDAVWRRLLEVSELTEEDLAGKTILELGPGDNLGLALRFVAAGASSVVTLDRFAVPRNPAHEQAIYRALIESLPPDQRARAEAAVRFGQRPEFHPDRIRMLDGLAIEEAAVTLPPESFDVILSVAVLEHVYDPDASFDAMHRLLKPGGLLLHEVDLRDHLMFTSADCHPLTFLTISPRVWRLMTSDSGRPNRRLVGWYREQTERLGYDTRLLVHRLVGRDGRTPPVDALSGAPVASSRERSLIAEIRPRLAEPFRGLSDDELAAAALFVVAGKPAPASRGGRR
jgi:SAM-dependent methyltransferase